MPSIRQHELGYGELVPRPTPDELREYYRAAYYEDGNQTNPYERKYSDIEIEHKRLAAKETMRMSSSDRGSVLDVGCGEGFVLAEFADAGWDVRGVDFTRSAVEAFFPNLADRVEAADVYDWLDSAAARGVQADVVTANHVLEHVLNPGAFIQRLRQMVAPGGLCRVVVPNDGSWLQRLVVSQGAAPDEFWKVAPDHVNYFDAPSLRRTLSHFGFEVVDLLGDFPIDFYLLHPQSNYVKDKAAGRAAHQARLAFETTLARRSVDELLAFRRGCAAAGVGRSLIAYCRPSG